MANNRIPKPPAADPTKAAAAPETTAYVVQHTPVLHDGDLYMPGDTVELTDKQATAQGGNVAPAPEAESAKE